MFRGPKTRIVRCCLCKGMMRVSARALSVSCPHCQNRISLESLRIIGSHPGKTIATCGDIVIEATARLNLAVTGRNVVVLGRVCGPVNGGESIEVGSTGHVIGDIKAPKIVVRDGAVIEGGCEMLHRDQHLSDTCADETAPREHAVAEGAHETVPRQASDVAVAAPTHRIRPRPLPPPRTAT